MHYYSFECMLIHKVRVSSHSHKVRLQHIDSLTQRYIFCGTRRHGYNTTHLYSCVVRGATQLCTQLHLLQETRFYSLLLSLLAFQYVNEYLFKARFFGLFYFCDFIHSYDGEILYILHGFRMMAERVYFQPFLHRRHL